MKKFLISLIGLGALLTVAGCQREVAKDLENDPNEVAVSFNVGLDGLKTKANANYSTGTHATTLEVLVYKQETSGLKLLPNVSQTITGAFANEALTQQVSVKLVKGVTYNVVFWASDPTCRAYTLDKANAKITVAPGTADVPVDANDESRDAFFGSTGNMAVTTAFSKDVELKRPFAQINVLDRIADWNTALDNAIVFTGSTMTVEAPTVLDLVEGAASEPAPYVFGVTMPDVDNPNIAGYEDDADGAHYKYIAMNYILAGEKATADVAFAVYNNGSELYDFEVPAAPYQRNYRTIIVGDIFSVDGVFNVKIVPAYDGEHLVTMGLPVTVDDDSELAVAISDGVATFDPDSKTGTVTLTIETADGVSFDFSGIVPAEDVVAEPTYSSKPAGFITEDGVFTATEAGTYVITIHYNAIANGVEVKGENLDFDATDIVFTVTVAEPEEPVEPEPEVTGIVWKTEPATVTFTVDDEFVFDGAVQAVWSDESKTDIAAEDLTISGYDMATAGSQTVTVAYGAFSVQYGITVTAAEEPELDPNGYGTAESPYTVAGVRAFIDSMTNPSVASTDDIYVTGVISAIKYTFSSSFGTATFTMTADGQASDETFVAYGVYYHAHAQMWTDSDTQVAVGDEVVVCGKVLQYKDGTYETSNKNGYVVSIERGALNFSAEIDNTDEVAATGGSKTITITGNVDWTITAEGLTLSATSGFGAASVTVTVPANTDTENGKNWNVTVKTDAEVATKNFPFQFTQAKAEEQQQGGGDEPVEETFDVEATTTGNGLTWASETHDTYGAGFSATTTEGVKIGFYKNNSTNNAVQPSDDNAMRVYKNSALVITPESGKTIAKVVLTGESAKYTVSMTASNYTVIADSENLTITLTASEAQANLVAVASEAQVRVSKVQIKYAE